MATAKGTAIAALLALAACGAKPDPSVVVETHVQICPASKPVAAVCPALPPLKRTASREEVEAFVPALRPVHVQCQAALKIWDRTWTACLNAAGGDP